MRNRTKDSKAAWLIAAGLMGSIILTFVVPSGFRWAFIGSGVILFYLLADHLGSMATGFFRDGDMDPPPEVEKTSDAEVLEARKSQLLGKEGKALTEIVGSGMGEVDGQRFDCVADLPIAKNEMFRVTGFSMSELKIEKLNQPPQTRATSGPV